MSSAGQDATLPITVFDPDRFSQTVRMAWLMSRASSAPEYTPFAFVARRAGEGNDEVGGFYARRGPLGDLLKRLAPPERPEPT